MNKRLIKKSYTENYWIFISIIVGAICFFAFAILYFGGIYDKLSFPQAFRFDIARVGLACWLIAFLLMMKCMLYGGLPDGFWVYEYVVAYDKELYDKIYDNPKGDIHEIFSFLEALKMLNIKLDEDKASIWQHKENAICLDFSNHPVKKFAVYNGVAKKSKKGGRENCIDYGDYSCDDAFREFLKRLDIPKDTIDEIMTCYKELKYSRLLKLTIKNDKVIMFYRINKYHRKYFEDKFSFSPNFKDISQINMLLD